MRCALHRSLLGALIVRHLMLIRHNFPLFLLPCLRQDLPKRRP